MNVFVLNSGRCGSMTFIRACRHIRNYSAGHESRVQLLGEQRLAYAPDHIEADNRLCWLLGRLDAAYGEHAYYVHLSREPAATAVSSTRSAGTSPPAAVTAFARRMPCSDRGVRVRL